LNRFVLDTGTCCAIITLEDSILAQEEDLRLLASVLVFCFVFS
jgi:hypothetical protein